MGLTKGNCQNCGGVIEFDESLKKGFCIQCGTPFIAEQIVNKNIQNINIENAVIQNGSSIENLLLRARQYEEQGNFGGVREYANRVLDIDANNSEAHLLIARNRSFCIGLGTFKNTFILKKHVDEIGAAIKNDDLKLAAELFKRYARYKMSRFSISRILKKWEKSGIDSVIRLEYM